MGKYSKRVHEFRVEKLKAGRERVDRRKLTVAN